MSSFGLLYPFFFLGAIQKAMKGEGYSKKCTKACKGGKHSKQIIMCFEDCKRKIAFSFIFIQTFVSVLRFWVCINFCKL